MREAAKTYRLYPETVSLKQTWDSRERKRNTVNPNQIDTDWATLELGKAEVASALRDLYIKEAADHTTTSGRVTFGTPQARAASGKAQRQASMSKQRLIIGSNVSNLSEQGYRQPYELNRNL